MKQYTYTLIALAALWMSACDMRQPLKVGYEEPRESLENVDSTIYGFCGRASTPKQLQLITATNDTLYINVEEARTRGRVLGGYATGDELYVLPAADHGVAQLVINKAGLLGEWAMPSPYDGSSPAGIIIKDGGEAESLEQQGDIIYKSWRIFNGQIQIVETRDDGTDIDYMQTYDITRMTRDSLYLVNSEESYEYGRYNPAIDDLGVELDYDSQETFDLF